MKDLLIYCWCCITIVLLWIMCCCGIGPQHIICVNMSFAMISRHGCEFLCKLRKKKKLKMTYHFKGRDGYYDSRDVQWISLSRVYRQICPQWMIVACIIRSDMNYYTWHYISLSCTSSPLVNLFLCVVYLVSVFM